MARTSRSSNPHDVIARSAQRHRRADGQVLGVDAIADHDDVTAAAGRGEALGDEVEGVGAAPILAAAGAGLDEESSSIADGRAREAGGVGPAVELVRGQELAVLPGPGQVAGRLLRAGGGCEQGECEQRQQQQLSII